MYKAYYSIFIFAGFILPILIITASYIIILRKVRKSVRRVSQIGQRRQKRDQNVNTLVGLFFIIAIVSFGPYTGFQLGIGFVYLVVSLEVLSAFYNYRL